MDLQRSSGDSPVLPRGHADGKRGLRGFRGVERRRVGVGWLGFGARLGTRNGWIPCGASSDRLGAAGPGGFGSQTFLRRNQQSLYAIALATVYLVLSLSAHLVLFGIVPLFMSSRAWRHREPLAPVAIAASVITLLVAVATLTHH